MSKIIWIKCKQVCEYSQQHTVTDEEYKVLMEALDEDDCFQETHGRNSPYGIIEGYLDHSEILDTDHEFTDVQVEIYKPEKKKKAK